MLYEVINKVNHLATHAEFEVEVRKASAEYFALTGQVYEEDRSFEARMGLFLEWYLIDRPLDVQGVTPLQYFLKNPSPDLSPEELAVVEKILNHHHSIYEFNKAKDNIVSVTDLADKKKYQVHERRGTAGFLKGDIFEARLFPYGETLHFSGPMLFHPRGAKKYIKKIFKQNPGNLKQSILTLSAMSLKLERYRHVPLEKIYSNLI